MWASQGGTIYPWNGQATTYSIYGGGLVHAYSAQGGYICNAYLHVTITGNPTFSSSFYLVIGAAQMLAHHTVYNGTAIGMQYQIGAAGYLYTDGTYASIPGSVTGTIDNSTYGIRV